MAFFAVSAVAWYFKPLAGILSDSVPLFGTRRRHYLLLSATTAVLWLLVGVVPRSYASLLWAVVTMNAMLVMGSTVVGGLLVEAGQRYGATGRLTSARPSALDITLKQQLGAANYLALPNAQQASANGDHARAGPGHPLRRHGSALPGPGWGWWNRPDPAAAPRAE